MHAEMKSLDAFNGLKIGFVKIVKLIYLAVTMFQGLFSVLGTKL
jgi:hypothetical protein